MDKTYQPEAIENRWYQYWEDNDCFRPSGRGKPYCIMLPPPNVTGTLHMGHAFQHTLIDCLIRLHRMRGCNTLWQVGTDHAGIATEMVVGRQLEAEGNRRDELGRTAFIERVWQWKAESGSNISRQMRRLGASGDWSRERFTMDAGMSAAVIETFVRLYDEGLIYRGPRLVNWDPVLKTAISDLEVESREESGHLWSIRYPRTDGQGEVVVATTRPETLLGDVCVAVHPDDARYSDLVGKTIILPLCEREIPVIADDYVDPEFGSGCVKITPAHDFNDWEVGNRHGFQPINIFNKDAALKSSEFDDLSFGHRAGAGDAQLADNEQAGEPTYKLIPEKYRGLDRFEARRQIVADLREQGYLVDEKPHTLMIPRGDRSGEIIEPYLIDQWFVKMDELAERGLARVESGDVAFVPGNWINTYRHWLNNIQDWCISRQLWWGHQIPAWYDKNGTYYVGRNEDEARSKHGLDDDVRLERDPDVLETWFSSSLWSHSTLGWPDEQRMAEQGFDAWLPTSVLVTGFDIIFFWVARMIMMTDHFTGRVPFETVYIHGLIRDREGQKMSKSKGNILDPIDLIDGIDLESLVAKRTRGLMQPQKAARIEQTTRGEYPDGISPYGADALRFTFASLAAPGRDIKFDLSRCEGYRNFINKLWNAARFVLMHTGETRVDAEPGTDLPARWIRSRLARTIASVDDHFAAYRFDLAAAELYEFVWHELCDWYLELTKPYLENEATAANTRRTLAEVMETALRLLHPIIPFVTEEIWQRIRIPAGIDGLSVSLAEWPAAGPRDDEAEAAIGWIKTVIQAVRSARTELNLAPGKPMPLKVRSATDRDHERLRRFDTLIRRLARIESIERVGEDFESDDCAVALAGDMRLLIPLSGLVDIGEELARLGKQREREAKGLDQVRRKLDNEKFVSNAPAEVVEKERNRLAEHQSTLERLDDQIARLRRMRDKKT